MYRIAIIGPESSGKSTISRYISKEYGAALVEEYAREYLLNLTKPSDYLMEDLIEIANVQFDKFASIVSNNNKICISDTEMLTIKIWAEDKFNYCPNKVEELFQKQYFDLFFLCKPDIEWEYDILREDKDRRDYIFSIYENYCVKNKFKYTVIKGDTISRNNIIRNIFKTLNY